MRFQNLFNAKDSSKNFSQLFNFNGNTLIETEKLSAIITKLSNDYNAEENDEIFSFNKQSQSCLQN